MERQKASRIEDYLNPEKLKNKLIISSLFIASFESLKDYIVEELKFFYNIGFSGDKYILSKEYTKDVLEKDKSVLKASLLWFKDNGVLSDEDLMIFDRLRAYRNKLSHELMRLLFDDLLDNISEDFNKLLEIRIKIEKWWILNIEIPTNPDFDNREEITEDDITTPSQMIYKLILDMLSEDYDTAHFYINEMRKRNTSL